MIGSWLVVVAYVAGWDAVAFAFRSETFAGSYGRAFDSLPASVWAGWLAGTAVMALGGAGWQLAGARVPTWYLGAVALGHGFVCATFGWALFSLGWGAGTGANKWLIWALLDSAVVAIVATERNGGR